MPTFPKSLFIGAETAYEDARFAILGVPYDGTTSFRPGTRFGPDAIRALSYNFESYVPDLDIDLADVPVADIGDIAPASLPDAVVEQVAEEIGFIFRDGKCPVMLGGEHSITIGAVQVVRPECFVVCDAHLDLRAEFGGTPCSHACTTRRVYDEITRDIFVIGARSGTREQFGYADRIRIFSADEVFERGIGPVCREIAEAIGGRTTYLSIDADAIDCCYTPGLGTPEPLGLTPRDIRTVITKIAPTSVAFDYVEVCPIDAGQAATVGAYMVREFIAAKWKTLAEKR
jgi:agmatinase